MDLIRGRSLPETWLRAADYLAGIKTHEDFDVILGISDPIALSIEDAAVIKLVDGFLVSHGGYPVNTVAETIFPLDEYVRGGARGVFEDYPPKIAAIHKARPKEAKWGCYALRILRQVDRDGVTFNPLEKVVDKIKKHGKFRAANELGLGLPLAEDIPIYDPARDRNQYFGGMPCLSHVSIKVHDGLVRLNATYRSHYYVQRLLGNLIGLGRLQYFIARETGLKVGQLTINSTFAHLDAGSHNGKECKWGINDVKRLIGDCKAAYNQPAAAA
jgi:hypothetical protein